MKYFIYGARRSGKTTQCLKIIENTNLSIVWKMDEKSKRDIQGMLGGRKIHNEGFGLRYIRIYDNLNTYFKSEKDITSLRGFNQILSKEESFDIIKKLYLSKLDFVGTDTIVTCTPDNTEDRPYTPSYVLWQHALQSNQWKVIDLGGLDKSIYHSKEEVKRFYYSIPESIRLGAVLGEWYDKDKAEMEKKAAQKEQEQIFSPRIDWTFS